MGAAESVAQDPAAQVTPCRPIRNRHLSRVADPRSPSSGIPRTPIEVGDSPKRPTLPEQELEKEEVAEPTKIADPRSPTHGIARTPLRPSLHASLNLLAKQLSEVFVSENSGIEGSPSAEAEPTACPSLEEQKVKEHQSSPIAKVNEDLSPPVAEVKELPSTSVAEVKELPSTSVAEVKELPSTSVAEVKKLPSTSVAEVKELPSTSVAEVKELPSTSVAEVKELPSTSVAEVKELPSTPVAEVNECSSTPLAEVKELPSTPVTEMKEPEQVTVGITAVQSVALAQLTPPTQQPQKQRGKSPRNSGTKNIRQRPKKTLISAASGRSPLKILQEDNSPSTAIHNRQIRKISFQSEAPSSLRSLKMTHSSWQTSRNKENAQYMQSES
ncbi:cell division cycle-associated protein 3 [Gastrophryne carolinensis]